MGFTDWFGLAIKRNNVATIKKVKEQFVEMGAMAAGNPSEAASAIGRMVDQVNCPRKILMVQDGTYRKEITKCAMKIAQRLDCEIIALDVTDIPLQFSGDRKIRESDRFMATARKNGKQFVLQAQARGIKTTHVMDIGNTEKIIARISLIDAGIRYVISRPNKATSDGEVDHPRVSIIDLCCSQLQKAIE